MSEEPEIKMIAFEERGQRAQKYFVLTNATSLEQITDEFIKTITEELLEEFCEEFVEPGFILFFTTGSGYERAFFEVELALIKRSKYSTQGNVEEFIITRDSHPNEASGDNWNTEETLDDFIDWAQGAWGDELLEAEGIPIPDDE